MEQEVCPPVSAYVIVTLTVHALSLYFAVVGAGTGPALSFLSMLLPDDEALSLRPCRRTRVKTSMNSAKLRAH